MFVAGDQFNNNENTVKMMHSQLELLVSQVLSKKIVQKLLK